MKMRSTLVALGMCGVMALGLAGCGGPAASEGGAATSDTPAASSEAMDADSASAHIPGLPSWSFTPTPAPTVPEAEAPAGPEGASDDDPTGLIAAYAAYYPILRSYQALDTAADVTTGYITMSALAAMTHSGTLPLSYAMQDINGDNTPELFIAMKYEEAGNGPNTSGAVSTYRIYDAYYLEGSEPMRILDVQVLGSYESLYLCEGGVVGWENFLEDGTYVMGFSELLPYGGGLASRGYAELTADGRTFITDVNGNRSEIPAKDAAAELMAFYDDYTVDESLEWNLLYTFDPPIEAIDLALASTEYPIMAPTVYYRATLNPAITPDFFVTPTDVRIMSQFAVSYEFDYLWDYNVPYTGEWYKMFEITDSTQFAGKNLGGAEQLIPKDLFEQICLEMNGSDVVFEVRGNELIKATIVS